MITLIFAMDENRVIGLDNELPWHYKDDLIFYKNKVEGKTVLMGDLTYQSLKKYYKTKPLPYKKIYVANFEDKEYVDAIRINDLIAFLKINQEDIFIVGGKTIYELSLEFADNIYITYILDKHIGNVYIKPFSLDKYRLTWKNVIPKLIFTKYERIK
ncbi:MAG: dihydrofolate reductase [Acholeplasmataceae bacterium]|jgi:dihydrofolate reductase|nr:dihydrofolate reductase [Acholeplasmataceae bacterium]